MDLKLDFNVDPIERNGDLVTLYCGLDDDYIYLPPEYDTKTPRRELSQLENTLLGLSVLELTDLEALREQWPSYSEKDKAELRSLLAKSVEVATFVALI